MKKIFKKSLSIILSLLICLSSFSAVAAGAVNYPDGVTPQKAINAVNGTDNLIKFLLPAFFGGNLKSLINSTLYSDETLSDLLVNTYSSLEEEGDAIGVIGIDISVKTMSEELWNYPQISAALSKSENWKDVNLDGADWGITDKESFATALGAVFSPFNDILYSLFCSGTYRMNKFITIKGDEGYKNAIIPLYNSLFISGYMSQAKFSLEAKEDKNSMVKNIILPVLTWLESVSDAPVNALTNSLPSFAYYVDSGKFNENFNLLLSPITSNPLFEIATLLKILDLESLTLDVNSLLSSFGEESGIKIKEIDFSALAKCGKPTENGYESDKGLAYVEIMRWLIETLKLNKDGFAKLTGNSDAAFLNDLLGKDTDKLVCVIVGLFTKGKVDAAQTMVYPEFTAGTVEYTENLDEKDLQRVYNEIDDLLDDFVKEGGNATSVKQLIKSEIYTGANINALLKGVYGALEDNGLTEILKVMGLDCSPKGVANLLSENKYLSAKKTLQKASWKKVDFNNVNWGFYNGSRVGFQDALTAILRPLFPVLRTVLAGEDLVVMDSIYIAGADGYNTAIIPLLEALGCKNSSIKTYRTYKNNAYGDGVIEEVLNPIFDLLDDLAEKPVKTAVRILPNAVYFIESGSLEKCINNLLLPVTSLLGGEDALGLDTESLTKELNIENISENLLKDSGMKIADFDIKSLTTLGTKVEKESKAVINGKNVKYSYIEADTAGVVMALLRIVAKTMQLPGNENILMGTMGGSNVSFDVSSITKQLEGMSENEFIEWLVNLFFKERVKMEVVKGEDYSPTIIFTPEEKDYTMLWVFLGYLGVCVVVGIILFVNRKKLYGNTEVR